jgi:hypothetical protein
MHRVAVAAAVLVIATGCGGKKDEPAKRAEPPTCFDTHGRTSPAAQALFERHHLQGGGPTWRSILELAVRQHATIVGPETDAPPAAHSTTTTPGTREAGDEQFRDAYQVRYGTGRTWFSADDEAEGVRFCAGDPALLRDISGDFDRLNADPAALERAVQQANGIE